MQSKVNSFDLISRVYDTLARVVFGSVIRDCQFYHLSHLRDAHRILILGGGTGWFLEAVLNTNLTARISYVEASREMLRKSKDRCTEIDGGRVEYIHGTQDDVVGQSFDAVIANFYLDLFSEPTLQMVIAILHRVMSPAAILLVSDFNQPKTVRQRVLLRVMYSFFRVVSNIEAGALSDWRGMLVRNGFIETTASSFYGGFMQASVFRKR